VVEPTPTRVDTSLIDESPDREEETVATAPSAEWGEHEHGEMLHSHEHFHVTHNHSKMTGGFEHLSSSHEHEHNHGPLRHAHFAHQNVEQEHMGEAHVHDHSAPTTPATRSRSRSANKSAK
jgi:hypothetical protein